MEVCPACNERLSPKKPWIAKDEVSTWTVLEKNTGDMQADQMISVLSYYGIPARKYYKGSSQYVSIFTGMTSIGVYVIVPESELERARKILADAPAFDGGLSRVARSGVGSHLASSAAGASAAGASSAAGFLSTASGAVTHWRMHISAASPLRAPSLMMRV